MWYMFSVFYFLKASSKALSRGYSAGKFRALYLFYVTLIKKEKMKEKFKLIL